jgi:hypothetical protein
MRLRTDFLLRQKLRFEPFAYLQLFFADEHAFLVRPLHVILLNTPAIIHYLNKKDLLNNYIVCLFTVKAINTM